MESSEIESKLSVVTMVSMFVIPNTLDPPSLIKFFFKIFTK